MIKYYVNQISMGCITIDDVPETWREKVREALCGEEVEPPIISTDILQKAEAFDYLTGRSGENE